MEPTYSRFVEREGIPVLEQFAISDIGALPVEPWDRTGGKGCYVHLEGRGLGNSMINEIPPGKELNEQRHLYEETVFVYSGTGRTEFWNDAGFSTACNWQKGTTFAIPLNVHYRHINVDDTQPARLFSVSNMPVMMNLLHDVDFVFDCPHDFTDRFGPEVTDFSRPAVANGEGDLGKVFAGSVVPSAYDVAIPPRASRGANGRLLNLDLSNTSLGNHISEFPGRSYKKAHRHGAGAHVILLSGSGYSLLWKGDEAPVRVDWQPGAVIVPPQMWFHQHFNVGDSPARYLALRFGGGPHGIIPDYIDERPTREGGDQIEYEDESPEIKELFEAEIRGHAGADSGRP